MTINYGQTVLTKQVSSVKVTYLPFSKATFVVRTYDIRNRAMMERQFPMVKLPFGYSYAEVTNEPTQYFGVNSPKLYDGISSTWDKSLCPAGVKYELQGNGRTMKITVINPSKVVYHITGAFGIYRVDPGQSKTVGLNFTSGGLGVLVNYNQHCSGISWMLPSK